MNPFVETTSQQQLRKNVADLAGRYGLEYYVEKAKSGADITEVWEEAGHDGFLGVNIPTEYGGQGGGIYELQIVTEEFAAAGCPVVYLPISAAICATVLTKSGTEQQRKRWLPGFADGSARMAFAVTDPTGGSNLYHISASVRPEREGWVLSGSKSLISAVDVCDAMMVVARAHDPATGKPRLALFIVDRDTPGLSYEPVPMAFLAANGIFDVTFDEVRLPADALVGGDQTALKALFTAGLNPERITFAAWSAGLGRFAIDRAVRYANQRTLWQTSIGAHQGLAHPLAEAKVHLELARMCIQKAAWLYDHGQDLTGEVANMAKFAAGEAVLRAADVAVQIHGGYGMTESHGVGLVYTMARVSHLAPVSREMLLNYIAQQVLGLEKSY